MYITGQGLLKDHTLQLADVFNTSFIDGQLYKA